MVPFSTWPYCLTIVELCHQDLNKSKSNLQLLKVNYLILYVYIWATLKDILYHIIEQCYHFRKTSVELNGEKDPKQLRRHLPFPLQFVVYSHYA